MAIAGRVAIVPKGEYSNVVTYDKLDLVMYNNDAYIAKKASTGIEPTNDEYWMLILNNVVAENLEKIIDGTTPVGNALKLGGKGASEYALAEQIKNNSLWTALTSGFDLNNALGKYRADYGGITGTLLNLPPTSLSASRCEIVVDWTPADAKNLYGIQTAIMTVDSTMEVWKRKKNNATWSEWKQTATTADLANYLPLSGGTLTSSHSNMVLNIISALTTGAYIRFSDGNNVACFLGVNREGKPAYSNGNAEYDILHTGNRIELIGSASGVGNPIAFDTNVYKELYCELSYFGSAKVTFDIVIPNGGTYNSCLKSTTGVTGGSVYITGNTIQTSSFYFEDIARTDDNITLTVYGKR